MSAAWPRGARQWSEQEIASDVGAATAEFRARRLGEPLARYLAQFDAHQPISALAIERLGVLMDGADAHALAELCSTEEGRTVFRYLGAPPISDDDLATLAETRLTPANARDEQARRRVIEVMTSILDPRRFPWVAQRRAPTRDELAAATLATTTLAASQRVQTLRRGDEKAMVEGAVKGLLVGMGWQLAAARPAKGIQNLLNDSPPRRSFLTQINLGQSNADVVVRLDDGRLLAVECKGSNSEINSRKRLNKEAAGNARAWLERFGDQVVPAAALQGVFKQSYVVDAQATPMPVFWGHRLDDLRRFVEAAR